MVILDLAVRFGFKRGEIRDKEPSVTQPEDQRRKGDFREPPPTAGKAGWIRKDRIAHRSPIQAAAILGVACFG
ncbi:hypothetical protein J6590_008867 [Homalodisca vitripennis]|nr:hypothetical protein J6590_008867 [Homalodisca vitripennis]